MSDVHEPISSRQAGPRCPFCGSSDVEMFSLFGSQLLTEQLYCRACGTPFEHVKHDDAEHDSTWRPSAERTSPPDAERGSQRSHASAPEASQPTVGDSRNG